MYDPITRKFIIKRDVQFVENEAWDGTVENNVKIGSIVKHDDMTEEVIQTPHVSQNLAPPSTPRISQHVLAQGTSTQVTSQATPTSTPRVQQTTSRGSTRSTSANPINTRIQCEIYEARTPNSFSILHYFLKLMIL